MKRKTGEMTGARGEGEGKVLPGPGPSGGGTRGDETERASFESAEAGKAGPLSHAGVRGAPADPPSSSAGPFERRNPRGNDVNRRANEPAHGPRDATEAYISL